MGQALSLGTPPTPLAVALARAMRSSLGLRRSGRGRCRTRRRTVISNQALRSRSGEERSKKRTCVLMEFAVKSILGRGLDGCSGGNRQGRAT